jgi:hypothetical protein
MLLQLTGFCPFNGHLILDLKKKKKEQIGAGGV